MSTPGLIAVSLLALGFGCSRQTASTSTEPQSVVPSANSQPSSSAPSSSAAPHQVAADNRAATERLPDAALQMVIGCWQLDDRERWKIQPTERGGAQVTRTLLGDVGATGDYAHRASTPASLMFDEKQKLYAFVTAGRVHSQLFSFTVAEAALEGSWAVSRAPGAKYEPQPGSVRLVRCSADLVDPVPKNGAVSTSPALR